MNRRPVTIINNGESVLLLLTSQAFSVSDGEQRRPLVKSQVEQLRS